MIHDKAIIGDNVKLGEYVVIEGDVIIGNNVSIGNHVVIKKGTRIGHNVTIGDLSVLGKVPTSNNKMARKPNLTTALLEIHDQVTIGCNTVLYSGTKISQGVFIGDLASIRENVRIGEESIIGRNAMVEMNTEVGKRVTIQTGTYITADMVIEDEVFIGPCCSTSNDKYMGRSNYRHKGPILKKGAKIGNNATLLPGIVIGNGGIVGAGSVVTKDVLDYQVVVGSPARVLEN